MAYGFRDDAYFFLKGLGERDEAFEWLNKACDERSGLLVYLKVEPMFDPVRSDPRFLELARRVGMPA